MTSETNGQTDLSTPAKRKANITLLSFLLGDQTHLTPAHLGDGDNLGEPLPWLSRPGPHKIQVFMQPLVSKKRKRRKLLKLNTDDNLFLIELFFFFIYISMNGDSCTGSIFWHSPTMHCPHPLLLQPLHFPMSAGGIFLLPPLRLQQLNHDVIMNQRYPLDWLWPQHSFPLGTVFI